MIPVGGVDEAQRKKIEEIIDGMSSPKDFQCEESGFEIVCKARDVGLEARLECLAPEAQECPFAVPLGDAHYCHCPLRLHIARELNRSQ